MENLEKKSIVENLKRYVAKYPSQNKAAGSLNGISAGTLSSILNGNWKNISDVMWKKLSEQVKMSSESSKGWNIVEINAWQEITYAMTDAQNYKNVTWIVGEAGCGKTTTARIFAESHKEVFYILCSEDMYKGEFVRQIARQIGIRSEGYTIRELWKQILSNLIQMDAPLLIFDEADKLVESVFHYFISLYNVLEDRCGVIFLSTDYIERRIRNGLRYEKPGYKEFYSRIGRKYFELEPTSAQDVYSICTANGIDSRTDIDKIIKESEECEFDLRRVKKSIHRQKRIKEEE
jgi:DNA transposition AAA+ family ATPase